MAKQFLRIDRKRYKLSTIKMYESFYREDTGKKFGLNIYFAIPGHQSLSYHLFKDESTRAAYLDDLNMNIKDTLNIGDRHFRISSIKFYESLEVSGSKPFAIEISFAVPRTINKVVHKYATEDERDEVLMLIDGIVGGV